VRPVLMTIYQKIHTHFNIPTHRRPLRDLRFDPPPLRSDPQPFTPNRSRVGILAETATGSALRENPYLNVTHVAAAAGYTRKSAPQMTGLSSLLEPKACAAARFRQP
jgi:hypothetical protein